jgi:histidyl-tRNA synthetase
MIQAIRGMKDLYGLDLAKYDYLTAKMRAVGAKYGYSMIHTPILESTDVFQRSIGNETDIVSKEMYTFMDKGGNSVTLRPEGTAGVIRALVNENMCQCLPIKLMYCGEMFRYDRPQKGRLRQFHQFGFEYIGDKSPYVDGIMIAMASEILQTVGIFDFKILMNSLGDSKSREAYIKAIVKYLSRYEDKLSNDSKVRLNKNPLRILDSKDSADIEICSMAPNISDYLNKESSSYFRKVCEILTEYGVRYEVDEFLVRGLDYYTHTAFEIKSTSKEYGDSLGGGGRYDKLLSIFGGPDVSGIGFALGMERLMMIFNDNGMFKEKGKVAVIPVSDAEVNDAFKLFRRLQENDIRTEFIHTDKLSKKMRTADKLNCKIALILGEQECKDNTITVKFMQETEELLKTKTIAYSEVLRFLKYIQ